MARKNESGSWNTKHEIRFLAKLQDKPGFREKYLEGFRRRYNWGQIDREEIRQFIIKNWGKEI